MAGEQLSPLPCIDGELWWAPAFIAPQESAQLLEQLTGELPWRADQIQLFGRPVAIPRLQAWIGDPGCSYRYSGLLLEPAPWSPVCAALRDRVQAALQTTLKDAPRFNSVLANLYRDGTDSVGWHADDEPELGINPVIASLTLGAERRFCLRHRRDPQQRHTLLLPSGSLVVMAGKLQHHWQHALPKSRRPLGPRINLSFRHTRPTTA